MELDQQDNSPEINAIDGEQVQNDSEVEQEKETDNLQETSQSQFDYLYKYNNILNTQESRREQLLLQLKERRNNQVDELRGIIDDVEDDYDYDEFDEESVFAKKYKKRKYIKYGHRIMLSEWMSEVPSDLQENWLFKVCPRGIRNIVVATRGITKAYNKRNMIKSVLESNLPGGSKKYGNGFTLLDCIYRDHTFYVLDVLVWNSVSLVNASTEFRFYFLKTKLTEDLEEDPLSKFRFVNVQHEESCLENVENYFIKEEETSIDGILFYHRESPYISGCTPLVGWLRPYMIPEKLNVPVHHSYLSHRPKNYVNLDEYLKYVKMKNTKNKNSQDESNTSVGDMDTDVNGKSDESSMDIIN